MGEMRQKRQEQLTFPFAEGSEASRSETEGTEAPRVRGETEDPAGSQQLMEEVCERENRRAALKRVRANQMRFQLLRQMRFQLLRQMRFQLLRQMRFQLLRQGSPGIDGMTVDELPEYLEQHCS